MDNTGAIMFKSPSMMAIRATTNEQAVAMRGSFFVP